MESITASFYAPLDQRQSVPIYYAPTCFSLSLLPFLISNRQVAIGISFPVILGICLLKPNYTFGNSSDDYYNSAPFIAILLWYIDFVLCTPREGDGAPVSCPTGAGESSEVRWQDLNTTWARVKWAARLMMAPHRGIGWNWQVKGVPKNPYADYARWKFVTSQVGWAIFYYLQSVVALVVLGWSGAMREEMSDGVWSKNGGLNYEVFTFNAVTGWAGAVWVWDRLCCAYSIVAALTVAIGMFETWEWPPLMGSLSEAWSVRQMWSAVYHQTFRRMLSQPATRITRLLCLRKGSLASRYTQLYLTFAISCLVHQYQMFNVTRRDMGEFAFFMSQPLAITFEDFVQYIWRKFQGGGSRESRRFEEAVGAVWTLTWFSFSLHLYIRGLVEAEVVRDWLMGPGPLIVGASLTPHVLEGLKT